jgi:hypothetical protein
MDGNKQTAYFHQHPNKEITDRLVSIDLLGAGQSWSQESESDWRPRPERRLFSNGIPRPAPATTGFINNLASALWWLPAIDSLQKFVVLSTAGEANGAN